MTVYPVCRLWAFAAQDAPVRQFDRPGTVDDEFSAHGIDSNMTGCCFSLEARPAARKKDKTPHLERDMGFLNQSGILTSLDEYRYHTRG